MFERLIEQDIIQVDEKIAQKQKEEYRRTEGISLLLKQQDMKKLTSITKTWIRRFYTNEDQHKIKNHEIHAIPEHYKTPFLEHLLKLYRDKPNDRIWKIKQVLKYNDAYKYLKICIGEEKAEEWFGKYINKDLTL